MRRRSFLVSATGVLVTLAGCIGTNSSQPSNTTPTPEQRHGTDERPVTGDESAALTVNIESIHLQYGVVTPTSPDSIGISNPDTPYLVCSLSIEGSLSREELRLKVDDAEYSPAQIDRLYRTAWSDDHWYLEDRTEGLVLFEIPPQPASDLALTWPGGHHQIDAGVGSRLEAGAPQLSASLDVPSDHASGTAPPIDIEVTNTDSTDRRFLGALNRVGPQIAYTPIVRLSSLIPAGETVTLTVSDSWSGVPADEQLGDDDPDVTYHLSFPSGEDSANIRLDHS